MFLPILADSIAPLFARMDSKNRKLNGNPGFYADTGGSGNGDAALAERQTPLETLTGLGTRTPAIVQM
ncbi:MAG: hypothetical protein OXL96_26115 [Candidatus Poribacteria bacterium]|nr:hypothetical protein [Candidatus Poribacteria bacterium]